jgi:hypothetical protein
MVNHGHLFLELSNVRSAISRPRLPLLTPLVPSPKCMAADMRVPAVIICLLDLAVNRRIDATISPSTTPNGSMMSGPLRNHIRTLALLLVETFRSQTKGLGPVASVAYPLPVTAALYSITVLHGSS